MYQKTEEKESQAEWKMKINTIGKQKYRKQESRKKTLYIQQNKYKKNTRQD